MPEKLITLTGKYLHTQRLCLKCDCLTVSWQASVLGELRPGTYLIQIYEWLLGEECTQEIVTIDALIEKNAVFYDSAHDMGFAYEHHRGVTNSCACPDGYPTTCAEDL